MHAEVPLSRFTLTGIDDPDIQMEYEEVVESFDLYQRLLEMTREYWLLGEVFPFAHWNDGWLAFDQLAILNPDYIVVNSSPLIHGNLMQFEMEPDDATISIVKSNEPTDVQLRDLLDPVVVQAVESGTNIPLDGFNIAHIAKKASPYDLRGTSIVLRCLKDLLYCFVAGTKVVMSDGAWKSIEDIKVGEEVYTHKNRVRKVTETMNHVEDEVIRIKVNGLHEPIECTPDHEFLVWTAREVCEDGCGHRLTWKARKKDKHFVGSGPHRTDTSCVKSELTFEWRRADQLQQDDALCVAIEQTECIDNPVYKEEDFEVEITPGVARLLGYFAAEGHFKKNKQGKSGLSFTLNINEVSTLAKDICTICEQEFNIIPKVYPYLPNNSCNVFFSDKQIADMFYYYCNEYSHSKKLSSEIMQWPLRLQEQLLIGYMKGDGSTNHSISFSSTSRILAEQMCTILRNLGLDFVIYPAVLGTVAKYPSTHIHLPKTTDGTRRFAHKLNDEKGYKQEIENHPDIVNTIRELLSKGLTQKDVCTTLLSLDIKPVKGKKWDPVQIGRIVKRGEYISGARNVSRRFRKGNYIVHPIETVERVKQNSRVYCLNVEEDESFLIYKGIVVHNCDKLREAQMAIADRLMTPLQIFKLGDPKGDWLPDQEALNNFAETLSQGRDDPNFALVGHYGLQVEYVGANGKVLPIVPEFDFVRDRILAALFTNRAMLDGSGPTFANASVAFEILQLRYMSLRGLLENYIQQRLFKPMAEARGYYVSLTSAELDHGIRPSKYSRELAIPDINWLEKIRLLDDIQMKRFILQMRMRMDIPLETVCDLFDLDYTHIKRSLAKELGTVADPLWRQSVSKEIAMGISSAPPGKEGKGAAPGGEGAMPGMPGGESAPGAMGPAPREVEPEGGTSPGGPEIPGMQPETIGPGAGSGTLAGMKQANYSELGTATATKELQEQKREEALNQLEEETQTDNIPRKVFGVARNSTKQGVHRRGSSFYVVDKN